MQHSLSMKVDEEFKEGDRLDEVLPGLKVIDTPGHSPGHSCFWSEEKWLLFGGDVMMGATPDLEEAKRSIHKVAAMNVSTLCLGHGKPLLRNADAKIRSFSSQL